MNNGKKYLISGIASFILFAVWTLLIQTVDVQSFAQTGTEIGFSTFNIWFHNLTGVHMGLYTLTDWLGLVPVFVCLLFAMTGLIQLISRKSLLKVDFDVLTLGIYYVVVIAGYLIFEIVPLNYRPILISGRLEASYPSSTTLLVLSVMPTLVFQASRRLDGGAIVKITSIITTAFTVFMVTGRLVSGVHWFTDIVGAVLLSMGLFWIYKGTVIMHDNR